jgi:hypothetical protein
LSKITQKIEVQAFELIREKLGVILREEIDAQWMMSYDTDLDEVDVLIESTGLDKVELKGSVVNIVFPTATFGNKNQGSVDGEYKFFIDIYTNSKTTGDQAGSYRSAKKLHKLLGLCRSILEDPVYKKLDFTFSTPFIMRTGVTNIDIRANTEDDAKNSAMGRLTFSVTANEVNKLKIAEYLESYITTALLNETALGYFWEGLSYGG